MNRRTRPVAPGRLRSAAPRLLACAFAVLLSGSLLLAASPSPAAAAMTAPKIAAGMLHSLAVDDAGNVWSFGDNTYGQLGDGSTTRRYSPVKVHTATPTRKAVSVAAGDSHSLILMSDRSVWAFGANPSSALSVSTSTPKILSASPVRLANGGTLGTAVAVSAGGSSSAALLADGSVVVWGKGMRPTAIQSGGATLKGLVGVAVGSTDVVVLRSDGTVYQCEASAPSSATQVLMHANGSDVPLSNVGMVSAGKGFALAVSRSGQLYSFGTNANSVLGRDTGGSSDVVAGTVLAAAGGAPLTGVQYVDCGPDHAVAVLSTGAMVGWGLADNGRLGRGFSGVVPYPVAISLSGAGEVATGGRHILARSTVGTVWAFGSNSVGQADGDSTGILDPHVVTMTTRLWMSLSPSIKVVQVTETSIALSWRNSELYADNVRGFVVRWSLPDGTTRETVEMPAKTRGVTLGHLQSGANHAIRIVAIGRNGTAEETPALVVQTKAAVTPSISPDATPGPTGDATPAAGTPAPATPTPTPFIPGEELSKDLAVGYRRTVNGILLAGIVLAVLAIAIKVLAYRAAHGELVRRDHDD